MASVFPILFRNTTLRKHRRKVLFEREKALLPSLQIYVEYKRDWERRSQEYTVLAEEFGMEHVRSDKIASRWFEKQRDLRYTERVIQVCRNEIRRLREIQDKEEHRVGIAPEYLEQIPTLLNQQRKLRDASKAKRETLVEELGVLTDEYVVKRDALRAVQREMYTAMQNYNDTTGEVKTARREFIMRCPAENCRGFLSTAYKCGTCEAWACQACMVSIGKDRDATHTCNPDMVESTKMIRAETQPCPKCGTRIFKVDGCDQMWCTMEGCGTAFSWTTGHIVTGVIHNPHYYEWLRRNGGGALPREAGDIPCGGLPQTWQFVRGVRDVDLPNELTTVLLESFRNVQEVVNLRLPDYPSRMPQLMNKDFDVAYLMNRMDEEAWKRALENTEAKFNRKKEIGQILQTIVTAGSDMINRIYDRCVDVRNENTSVDEFVGWLLDTGLPELEQLRAFANDSLKALSKRDKMAVPQFQENWVWKAARALYRPVKAVKEAAVAAQTEATVIVSDTGMCRTSASP